MCEAVSGNLLCSVVLFADLEGWEEGVEERSKREGIHVHIQPIHFIV